MTASIPIQVVDGVELRSKQPGVASVHVTDPKVKTALPWDRFVRLKAAAEAIVQVKNDNILDIGGYDGALAFFLPGANIDLMDLATTGGSILEIPVLDRSYDVVVAVDVLEHIEPKHRKQALSELARVARQHIILNYPCRESKDAQELVLKLTNNTLIKEHVQWELPDSNLVLAELVKHGFTGIVKAHTSIAVWLGQYMILNLVPEVAKELDRYLVQHHTEEPFSKALYHLVVCERSDQ